MLGSEHFRSIRWRISLGIFDDNDTPSEAKEKLIKYRESYKQLKNELYVNNDEKYNDNDINDLIHVDIVRTFSGDEYFQRENTRNILTNILTVWSRKYSSMSYRQGMNELLAIVLICLRQDYQCINQSISKAIRDLVDEYHMEEDAFIIFNEIMNMTKYWYTAGSRNVTPMNRNKNNQNIKTRVVPAKSTASPLYLKFNRIHNVVLKQCDPELYEFLHMADILPQLYLLRWIRVLFCREFTLEQTLDLWDVILSRTYIKHHQLRGDEDDFVNFLCVSMLINIREKLLNNDMNGAIMMLMKYPPTNDLEALLKLAVSIQETGREAVLKFIDKTMPKNKETTFQKNAKALHHRSLEFAISPFRILKESFISTINKTSISAPPPSNTNHHENEILFDHNNRNNLDSIIEQSHRHPRRKSSFDDLDVFNKIQTLKSCGWLVKQGGGRRLLGRRSLKKRWFILEKKKDGSYLSYYENEKSVKPLKTPIRMQGRMIRIIDRSKYYFAIFSDKGRTYHLYAPTYRDMIDWVSALQTAAATNVIVSIT